MNFTWLTDIHLNFLQKPERVAFYEKVKTDQGKVVLISGDIAEAPSVAELLTEMAHYVQKPIYFVLGNHDYYRGQIATVKADMIKLTQTEPLLHWLPACEPIVLEEGTVLVGQDGWADGRYGDYANTPLTLNDSRMIADLFQQKIISKFAVLDKMQQLADADAKQLYDSTEKAIALHQPKNVLVVTHVPPFKETCLYQGKVSNDHWLPYFGSKATGDLLLALATAYPHIQFLTLCGHTHDAAHYQPLPNLMVKAGRAEYYKPEVQHVQSDGYNL